MKEISRRSFLTSIGAAATGSLAISANQALSQPTNILSEDRRGVLVDTSNCVGCRSCEWACKNAHGIDAGDIESYKDRSVFNNMRRPGIDSYTVVNEFSNEKNPLLPIDVKVQCMHCDKPACVSACIVGAINKHEDGSVVWDTDKCIGCRYCMVACQFQIPVFEFEKAIQPEIRKCDFCYERFKKGKLPACVEICPLEALTYGPRNELIKLARQKIKRNPEKYINYIYGEKEVGGTSWLYLASRDFQSIGLPKLNNKPAPGVSESIQHGIFAYFVPPVALYSWLGAMMWITKRKEEVKQEKEIDYV
ncbi:MAG: 4Fe-4S dicluster domain-containing protein [Bacteroidetes bacterium]|nr:MAG: 4Fe-4S dicluster domain-containing protein [Bacteroidota bacterium]